MSAKSELLAWVESRATNADDVKDASRLIAAFVAEFVGRRLEGDGATRSAVGRDE